VTADFQDTRRRVSFDHAAGQAKDPFGNDVSRDFGCASADGQAPAVSFHDGLLRYREIF